MKPESEPTVQQVARAWLSLFEQCARQRNYEGAKQLFHERVVWMGTETNVCSSIEQAISQEFTELWPFQLAFTCDLASAAIIPCADMILVALPWTAQSVLAGGKAKRGRLTVALAIFEEGKTLCVHGHQSLNPA